MVEEDAPRGLALADAGCGADPGGLARGGLRGGLRPRVPRVERPTFSRFPPSAYRLAEPGDTLDRVEIYLSSVGVVLAAVGVLAGRGRGYWPAGLAIALAGFWYAATPGPAVRRLARVGMAGHLRCPGARASPGRAARGGGRGARGRRGVRLASSGDDRGGLGGVADAGLAGALGRGGDPGDRPSIRDPGRRAGRLLAAVGDDRRDAGLRPGDPDRAGTPAVGAMAMGRRGVGRRRPGSAWSSWRSP